MKMRSPCSNCHSLNGVSTEKNGQIVVRCAECQRYMYNQPQGGKDLARITRKTTELTAPTLKEQARNEEKVRKARRPIPAGLYDALKDFLLERGYDNAPKRAGLLCSVAGRAAAGAEMSPEAAVKMFREAYEEWQQVIEKRRASEV